MTTLLSLTTWTYRLTLRRVDRRSVIISWQGCWTIRGGLTVDITIPTSRHMTSGWKWMTVRWNTSPLNKWRANALEGVMSLHRGTSNNGLKVHTYCSTLAPLLLTLHPPLPPSLPSTTNSTALLSKTTSNTKWLTYCSTTITSTSSTNIYISSLFTLFLTPMSTLTFHLINNTFNC